MNHIENVINAHRTQWFKDHKASLYKHGDLMVLNWATPGTSYHAIRYVFDGQYIYITGDCGIATYRLTELASPSKVSKYCLSYLTGKMECFSGEKHQFNSDKAVEQIQEWYDDTVDPEEDEESYINDMKEIVENLKNLARNSGGKTEWEHRIWSFYENGTYNDHLFDSENASYIVSCGLELHPRLIVYLLGIQMAVEQLDEMAVSE